MTSEVRVRQGEGAEGRVDDTFTADAAWNFTGSFIPALSDSSYQAVQETHHVLRRTQSCGVLQAHTCIDTLSRALWWSAAG